MSDGYCAGGSWCADEPVIRAKGTVSARRLQDGSCQCACGCTAPNEPAVDEQLCGPCWAVYSTGPESGYELHAPPHDEQEYRKAAIFVALLKAAESVAPMIMRHTMMVGPGLTDTTYSLGQPVLNQLLGVLYQLHRCAEMESEQQ